ncbi:hypothetical protein C0J52_00009 [Blattella germanica]|nr:hypothetical protein C0J52_00009 [Blattella germanica]
MDKRSTQTTRRKSRDAAPGSSRTKLPSPTIIKDLKSLYCCNIPNELMNRELLREHFEAFGPVVHLYMSVKRNSCTVHFQTHEAAESAKVNGSELSGFPVHIFWSQPASSRSVATSDKKRTKLPQQMTATAAASEKPKTRIRKRPKEQQQKVKTEKDQDRSAKTKRLTYRDSEASPHLSSDLPSTTGDDLLPELLELWNLKSKSQFHRPEDRCHILDLRDKILRIKGQAIRPLESRTRQRDVSRHVSRKGTLSSRISPTTELLLDHSLAIKQYSRSSADQDEPLPHELRPPHVLRMTMDYLLAKIMDRCDLKNENLREWYHFLWDRTRGIRKDITHQELCDMDAVNLIEECVRFHIHCSERLVAEKSSVFDSKINSENLTKCLQTLKYMYHDMSLKGVACPNEAEFRAYIILLNLGDSNFLWELKDLRPEIIKSEAVQFGVQVFHKLNNNNYVGFFNLVKTTSYLNACILLRYFYQVRSKALQIIVKSHCPVTKQVVLSLGELVRLLGFEDAREAALFCDHHGLRLEESNSEVMILKESLSLPTHALPTARAVKLIESKRRQSTIKGGPLRTTSFENHKPYSSFNPNGTLKEGAVFAEPKSDEELKRLEEEAARIRRELEIAEQARLEETLQDMLSEIIREEIDVFRERLDNVAILDLDEMLLDVMCNMTREAFKEVATEEEEKKRKQEEELRRRREEEETRREMLEKAAKECAAELLEETSIEMISEVVTAEAEHHCRAMECMEKILAEEIGAECSAVLAEEILDFKLNCLRLRRKHFCRKKYFNLWRAMVKKRQEKRRAMEDFPAWSSQLTLAQQAKSPPDAPRDEMLEIRFFDLVAVHLCVLSSRPSSFWKFYKLVVSLPDATESPLYSEFLEKFTSVAFPETKDLPMQDPPRLLQRMSVNSDHVLAVSMRCLIGRRILERGVSKPDSLRGMNGLLFVVPHDSPSMELARLRLFELTSARRNYGGIALAIILTKAYPLDEVEEMLQIKQLTKQNVTVELFVRQKGPSGLLNTFMLAVYWLASQHPSFPTPYFATVSFLVETFLQTRLWEKFQCAERLPAEDVNRLKLDLDLVIRIHNKACKDLCCMVTDEEVASCSIGAPEFAPYIPKDSDEDMLCYRVMPSYHGTPEYKEKLTRIFKASEFVLPALPRPKNKKEFEEYVLQVCLKNSLMCQWRLSEIDFTDATFQEGSTSQPIVVAVQPHKLNRFLVDQWNYVLGDPDMFNRARRVPREQCCNWKPASPVLGTKRKSIEESAEETMAKYAQPALESVDRTFKRCKELGNCKTALHDLRTSMSISEARQTELRKRLSDALEMFQIFSVPPRVAGSVHDVTTRASYSKFKCVLHKFAPTHYLEFVFSYYSEGHDELVN